MTAVTQLKTEPQPRSRVWRKVNSHVASGNTPRLPCPRFVRSATNPQTAHLILPTEMIVAHRANVLFDGDRSIGFEPNDAGDYRVMASGSFRRQITIPRPLVDMIPIGITPVVLIEDAGMLVARINPAT